MPGGRRPGHRLAQLGALLGLDPPPLPVAWFAPADARRAEMLLPGDGPWIALGPTANWDRKVWPAERFVTLTDALTAPAGPLAGARVAVLGGPGAAERAMAAPVLDGLGDERAVDLVGNLSLPEAAAVLARCALFVGNDSGLMHLSAATGTPTLGLFGPSPRRPLRARRAAHRGRRRAWLALPRLDAEPDAGRGASRCRAAALGRVRGGGGMTAMPRVSALVVARNEAARLPPCLESLAPADELVVVLDRSTDGSRAIASRALCRAAPPAAGRRLGVGRRASQCRHRCLHRRLDSGGGRRRARAARALGRDAPGFRGLAARFPPRADRQPRRRAADPPRLGRQLWHDVEACSFRRGVKRWRAQRVHPGLDWTGTEGAPVEGPASATRWTATSPTCCAGSTATPPPRPPTSGSGRHRQPAREPAPFRVALR